LTKAKPQKWDNTKLKSICPAKEKKLKLSRVKRKPMEVEKRFANHISNNGLIAKKKKIQNGQSSQTDIF
jgi:hypothetical protein